MPALAVALAGVICDPVRAQAPATDAVSEEESLSYRWHLKGITGLVARLFVPGKGNGVLETSSSGDELATVATDVHPSHRAGLTA